MYTGGCIHSVPCIHSVQLHHEYSWWSWTELLCWQWDELLTSKFFLNLNDLYGRNSVSYQMWIYDKPWHGSCFYDWLWCVCIGTNRTDFSRDITESVHLCLEFITYDIIEKKLKVPEMNWRTAHSTYGPPSLVPRKYEASQQRWYSGCQTPALAQGLTLPVSCGNTHIHSIFNCLQSRPTTHFFFLSLYMIRICILSTQFWNVQYSQNRDIILLQRRKLVRVQKVDIFSLPENEDNQCLAPSSLDKLLRNTCTA